MILMYKGGSISLVKRKPHLPRRRRSESSSKGSHRFSQALYPFGRWLTTLACKAAVASAGHAPTRVQWAAAGPPVQLDWAQAKAFRSVSRGKDERQMVS